MRNAFEDRLSLEIIVRNVVIMALCVLLCRVSHGAFALAMLMVGVFWALKHNVSYALACYSFFPMMVVMNGMLLSKAGLTGLVLRVGPLLMSLALLISASHRRGRSRLPFEYLMPYLILVTATSMQGFAPQVSFLKVINFLLFLIGIWIGTQNIDYDIREANKYRHVAISLVCFIVVGSLCTIPFPAIGYAMNVQDLVNTYGTEYANEVFKSQAADGGVTLFSGIFNQSQALAPTAAICTILAACDMFFVHQKKSWIHLLMIGGGVVETFMTRSRTGLFTLFVGWSMIALYGSGHIVVPPDIRRNIRQMIYAMLALGIAVAGGLELKNGTMTKWLRKSNDDKADTRSLGEAVTASRRGLIERSMEEFHRNPLFGSGFQVNFETMELHAKKGGLILSAPIEKGLLPVMVLGESGIVGSVTFAFFLIAFYAHCNRHHFCISVIMFTTFLGTNIGEATFFSPGGCGGILWMVSVVAGFALDMVLSARRSIARKVYGWR